VSIAIAGIHENSRLSFRVFQGDRTCDDVLLIFVACLWHKIWRGLNERHDGYPAGRAEFGFEGVDGGRRGGFGGENGEGGGAAAGHEGSRRAVGAEEFLIEGEDGEFFERGGFEGVVDIFGGTCEVFFPEGCDQALSAAAFAVEGGGEAGEFFVCPRRGDAEAG